MKRLGPVLLVLGVLALGVLVMMALVKTKPTPERTPQQAAAPLVETASVQRIDTHALIRATGTVMPSRSAAVSTEVAGRVAWVSDNFVAGGQVSAGEPLLKLEFERFELAVARAKAELARTQTELELERGRVAVAAREWALFNDGDAPRDDSGLARREPQLAAAKASVSAARANLREARLNLSRATIAAPFDGIVQAESVDSGQYIAPGGALGQLVGTKVFWVQTSVPLDRLQWITVPGVPGTDDANGSGGSDAIVSPSSKVGEFSAALAAGARRGAVVRLLGDLDPQGRLARLMVAVPDPLAGPSPMLIGAFVNVTLRGRALSDVLEVPRSALVGDDGIWVVTPDKTLTKRTLDIVWRAEDMVYARSGIGPDEQILTSRLPLAVDGMTVRLPGDAVGEVPVAEPEESGESDA